MQWLLIRANDPSPSRITVTSEGLGESGGDVTRYQPVKILSVTYGLPTPNEGAKIRDYHLPAKWRVRPKSGRRSVEGRVQMPDAGPLHEFCASVEPFRVPKGAGASPSRRQPPRDAGRLPPPTRFTSMNSRP